jgi:DNA-binding IclR family transcriptional regulator
VDVASRAAPLFQPTNKNNNRIVGVFDYAMYNDGPTHRENKELARVKRSGKTVSREKPAARTSELSSGSIGRPGKKMGAHGVQSAETLLTVLSAFVGAEPTPMLKTLAERTEMHPAKVHRYLVSLSRAGYVEQDEMTSRYRLGPAALRLAFAAMNSIDVIRVARPLMADFCNRLQNTVVLAVWNTGGPTIAARETLPGLLAMTATEGFVLPILQSSIGGVFGAYLPRAKTASLVAAELARPQPGCPRNEFEIDDLFTSIRRRGLARTTGQLSAGTHSFATAVFDASGLIVGVLCALGPAGHFDSNWNSPIAKTLRACAGEISERLGYTAPE